MDTRYEEALERARAGVPIDEVFPELKESEDERIRKNCIHFLGLQKAHHADTSEIDECISYLEKQKEQKPAEWSEEDEKMLETFLHKLEVCDLLTNKEVAWAKHRLKSIRPQPRWKPSEEQMEAFRIYLYNPQYIDNSEDMKIKLVESLYADLQKLL